MLSLVCLCCLLSLSFAGPPNVPNMPLAFEWNNYDSKTGKNTHVGINAGIMAAQITEVPDSRLIRDFVNKKDYFINNGSCVSYPTNPLDDTAALFPKGHWIAENVLLGYGSGAIKVNEWAFKVPGYKESIIGVETVDGKDYPVYFIDGRTPDSQYMYWNITLGVTHPEMWKIPVNCPPKSI